MTLPALASAADLTAVGVDTGNTARVKALLAAASAAVRDAAGCSITLTTGTVLLSGGGGRYLHLPGWAVSEVTEVTYNGTVITDWRHINDQLFRTSGWGGSFDPPEIAVTYTQGIPEAPADIINLVCSLVAAGLAASEDGYNPNRGISSERIDDYQRSFTRGDDEVINPMELPPSTRAWLRQRFGSGSAVTGELA